MELLPEPNLNHDTVRYSLLRFSHLCFLMAAAVHGTGDPTEQRAAMRQFVLNGPP